MRSAAVIRARCEDHEQPSSFVMKMIAAFSGPPPPHDAGPSQKLCYCETVKNITVSVPDDVYRNARIVAAQRDTSVSALVVAFLEQLSGRMDEFARLEILQHEVQAGIGEFRAAGRLSRDEVHGRAVR